jgi:alkyl hydroperoxide reductase subunit AhpC
VTEKPLDKCVTPAKGPIPAPAAEAGSSTHQPSAKEEYNMIAKVGKPAPDFETAAYMNGGFQNLKLSDYRGKWLVLCIGQVYGVFDDEAGVDIRGRFIIDPDGVIVASETLTPPVGRNPAELIRQIKVFQHVRATGEICPSGWQPGNPL